MVAFVGLLAASVASRKVLQSQVDHFGRPFMTKESKNFKEVIIDASRQENLFNPEVQVQNLEKLGQSIKKNQGKKWREIFKSAGSDIIQCNPDHEDFFKFAAMTVARLTGEEQHAVVEDSFCFKKLIFTFKKQSDDTIETDIKISGPKRKPFCGETYLVSTGAHFHLFEITHTGTHRTTFTKLTNEDFTYIKERGVTFMRFCDSLKDMLPDILMTVQMFLGGLGDNPNIPFFGSHVPQEMQEANVKFIKDATGFQWKKRKPVDINLDHSMIQSGDFLSITRFDGLDNIIHYGAGSHSGHSTMALWDRTGDKPELYVVESQDAWYWPTHGLQRTKFDTWMQQARNADFNVVLLPLRKEMAQNFDEDKAWAWFKKTAGLPYGYRNFLFGWIDTKDQNYPPILDIEFIFIVFRLLEQVSHGATDRLMKEALNWRLGTKGLKLWEIEEEANKQGKTLNDLMAIVETEGHEYSDGFSYVCSSYVMSFYTRSGMIPYEINATELSPKDIYNLDVFDKNWKKPDICQETDPSLPYCQLSGQWLMELPGYSTVKPYAHMDEKCPTLCPEYFRPDGC